MLLRSRKTVTATAAVSLIAGLAFAADHHKLNGTWILMPARTDFTGQPVIQTGTITIDDRQGNIFISRNFTYDGASGTLTFEFSTDGRESSSVCDGKSFKSKAIWEGDVLEATTTEDNVTSVKRYSLTPDGHLMVGIERPGHPSLTLFFQRQ